MQRAINNLRLMIKVISRHERSSKCVFLTFFSSSDGKRRTKTSSSALMALLRQFILSLTREKGADIAYVFIYIPHSDFKCWCHISVDDILLKCYLYGVSFYTKDLNFYMDKIIFNWSFLHLFFFIYIIIKKIRTKL